MNKIGVTLGRTWFGSRRFIGSSCDVCTDKPKLVVARNHRIAQPTGTLEWSADTCPSRQRQRDVTRT